MMKLLGHFMSPYTRRVAVSLHVLGIPFELVELSVIQQPERVRPHNPVLRIPTVVLDDGEPLVESGAILDEIDQIAGPTHALIPPGGANRRRVLQTTALAIASMEKVQWGYYERRFRPPEKVHQPWIDHNNAQALGGLQRLDAMAAALPPSGWLAGTAAISQADITTAVVTNWVREGRPELKLDEMAPSLCRFAERCEQLPAFKAAPQPKSEAGRPGVYIPQPQ
jgi:glutathione S-transferase